MTGKKRTPAEDYLNNQLKKVDATRKMDQELNKIGKKTPSGGRVWTVGDMQNFFNRKKGRR